MPVKLPHLEEGKKAVGEWPRGGGNEAGYVEHANHAAPEESVSQPLDAASMVYQAPVRPGVTEKCQPNA